MDEFVKALEKTNINNENKKNEGEGSKKADKKPDEEKGNDDEKMSEDWNLLFENNSIKC